MDTTPITDVFGGLGFVYLIITVVLGIAGFYGELKVAGETLFIGSTAIGTGVVVGGISGIISAAVVLYTVITFAADRCNKVSGSRQCVAGVISHIENSFSSTLDDLLPFTAMHDRVDLIVKSDYWDIVESNQAFVFCTDDPIPRRSEILRCYYYDRRVCEAANGAATGAAVAAVPAVLAAAAMGALIGCTTIIFCVLAIIVAALVAAAVVLAGAAIGGHAAKGEDQNPMDDDGSLILVGDLIAATGNMLRREHDNSANVFWWTEATTVHGSITDTAPRPFSYCEVNDELPLDGCMLPRPVP
ncbi:MAG: hypothetical protein AAFW81_00810 [Pseudomonadota bacterium]